MVDKVVDTVSAALQRNGMATTKAVERWYKEMPREEEMLPKDKYTIFDRKERRYRKGIHSKSSCRTSLHDAELRCRIAQMDAGQPTGQSSWFLSGVCSYDEDFRGADMHVVRVH
jgi:hypothetical protein